MLIEQLIKLEPLRKIQTHKSFIFVAEYDTFHMQKKTSQEMEMTQF